MNKTEKQTLNPQLQKTPVSGSRFVPMLFSTEMVKAILNGTKTETRRKIDVDKSLDFMGFEIGNNYRKNHIAFGKKIISTIEKLVKQKVNVDDVIWVRETFCNDERGSKSGNDDCYYYRADMPSDKIWSGSWKPSLFMPKIACRIFLKCVSVHVEKLHDIDEQGAINEGIMQNSDAKQGWYKNYLFKDWNINMLPKNSFMTLWHKINGKDSWDLNPYVFVYKFERIERLSYPRIR